MSPEGDSVTLRKQELVVSALKLLVAPQQSEGSKMKVV